MTNITAELTQIIASQEAFARLMQQRLPAKTAYRLQKLARAIGKELGEYDEMRVKLVQEYGGVQEGEGWRVPPEKMDAFVAALNELLDEKLSFEISPLDIERDLGSAEISGQDMLVLSYLCV